MTVEVLVKAAAGRPDTLGDCEYSALPLPFPLLLSFFVAGFIRRSGP